MLKKERDPAPSWTWMRARGTERTRESQKEVIPCALCVYRTWAGRAGPSRFDPPPSQPPLPKHQLPSARIFGTVRRQAAYVIWALFRPRYDDGIECGSPSTTLGFASAHKTCKASADRSSRASAIWRYPEPLCARWKAREYVCSLSRIQPGRRSVMQQGWQGLSFWSLNHCLHGSLGLLPSP